MLDSGFLVEGGLGERRNKSVFCNEAEKNEACAGQSSCSPVLNTYQQPSGCLWLVPSGLFLCRDVLFCVPNQACPRDGSR